MKFFKCFAIVLILLSFGEVHATDGTPCGSNQSINITGAVIHSNGSANFNGQVYPSGSYGHFQNAQFEEVDEANKNRAHLRGCFCRLKGKPCLPFCCPVGFVRRENSENCYGYTHEEYVNTSNLADRKVIRARDKFRLVQGVPCINDTGYILSKDVEWELFDVSFKFIRR